MDLNDPSTSKEPNRMPLPIDNAFAAAYREESSCKLFVATMLKPSNPDNFMGASEMKCFVPERIVVNEIPEATLWYAELS